MHQWQLFDWQISCPCELQLDQKQNKAEQQQQKNYHNGISGEQDLEEYL